MVVSLASRLGMAASVAPSAGTGHCPGRKILMLTLESTAIRPIERLTFCAEPIANYASNADL